MVNFSNKLTIILTLAGREEFTQRWLGYMNHHSCPYQIIIGDSGSDVFFDDPKKLNTYFPNLNCSYHRFTPPASDSTELSNLKNDIEPIVFYFQEKLATLLNLVETDYVVLDDNDNFYALDNFKKYIDFLDSDQSYVGARGRADRFWLYSGMNISAVNKPYGREWIAFSMKNFSIEQDASIDRLDYLLTNVDKDHVLINWYSMFRTTAMKQVFNALNSVDPLDVFASEVMALSFLLNSGKIKVYDDIYFLQQHGATSSAADLRASHSLPLRRMVLQNRWRALYKIITFFNFNDYDRENFLTSFSKMLETHVLIINNDLGFWQKKSKQLSAKFPLLYFLAYKLYYFISLYLLRRKFFRPKQLDFLRSDI